MAITVTTNYNRRNVTSACELTLEQRNEFGYVDWPAIERGEDSRDFVMFKGQLIDLNDMERGYGSNEMPLGLERWDNYISDSFFSGIVIKYDDPSGERVIVGTYYAS